MECYTYLRNVTDLLSDGKTPYERRFGQTILKDRLFPFGSLVWVSPYNCEGPVQDSINLERKSYLEYSSDTLCTRGEFGRGDVLVADLEELETMDASEIYSKKTQCERGDISQRRRIYSFSNRRWTNQTPWRRSRPENIHLDTAATNSRRKSPWFSCEPSEGSLPPPHDSFPDAGEAINDFWYMSGNFIYRHHVWTQSQTLLAEKRFIPCSTEVHWRIQNYSYKFGCQTRETASMTIGISMGQENLSDPWTGFTQFTLLDEKPPNGYMWVRWETNEKTADFQARSFNGQNSGSQRERMPSWRRSKSGRMKSSILRTHKNCEGSISLTRRIMNSKKPSRMLVRNWKHQSLLLCFAKLWRRIVGVVDPTK